MPGLDRQSGNHLLEPLYIRDQRILVNHAGPAQRRETGRHRLLGVETEHVTVHAHELRETLGQNAVVPALQFLRDGVKDDDPRARALRFAFVADLGVERHDGQAAVVPFDEQRLAADAEPTLDYRVPDGQDPTTVVVALGRDGFQATADPRDTQLVHVACPAGPDRERARVRAVIASVHTTGIDSGAPFVPGDVRFDDEA